MFSWAVIYIMSGETLSSLGNFMSPKSSYNVKTLAYRDAHTHTMTQL